VDRRTFNNNGLTLSYLDSGGNGPALIALHAHWLEAKTFAPFAAALGPDWRVIALDQRGHGYSSHAPTYTRQDYLADLSALFDHLHISKAVLLGNSLGGVNAYQFAALYPDRVLALIIEDIGVVIADDTSFCLAWSGSFATYEELAERVGARFLPFLKDSIRSDAAGWRLAFDPKDMVQSQSYLNGDHWTDWLASSCPALVIRGRDSQVTNQQHLEQMVERRPGAQLKVLPGGHVVHADNLEEFTNTVREFLADLPR
jgi:pimeloyl-ACP methyl ester carboxylesterase